MCTLPAQLLPKLRPKCLEHNNRLAVQHPAQCHGPGTIFMVPQALALAWPAQVSNLTHILERAQQGDPRGAEELRSMSSLADPSM